MSFCQQCGQYEKEKGPSEVNPNCVIHSLSSESSHRGYVITHSANISVQGLYTQSGKITLSELINDLRKNRDYHLKIKAAKILTQLGADAIIAVDDLKLIIDNSDEQDVRLKEACAEAIKRIAPDAIKKNSYAHLLSNSLNVKSKVNKKTEVEQAWGVKNEQAWKKAKKVMISNVEFEEVQDNSLTGNENISFKCGFCEYETIVSERSEKLNSHLTHPGEYFCNFCLRHRYNTKINKDILVMSYGGIISYYYYALYKLGKSSMYVAEIEDYVSMHRRIGLKNPIFSYDEDSLLWFIDFSRVGKGKRKLDVTDVLKTVVEQLTCFNMHSNIKEVQSYKLYEKYKEAIMDYYQHRKRPPGKKVCWPTLFGCGPSNYTASVATSGKKIPWVLQRFGAFKWRDIERIG